MGADALPGFQPDRPVFDSLLRLEKTQRLDVYLKHKPLLSESLLYAVFLSTYYASI